MRERARRERGRREREMKRKEPLWFLVPAGILR